MKTKKNKLRAKVEKLVKQYIPYFKQYDFKTDAYNYLVNVEKDTLTDEGQNYVEYVLDLYKRKFIIVEDIQDEFEKLMNILIELNYKILYLESFYTEKKVCYYKATLCRERKNH